MRLETKDGSRERKILTGMITDPVVLGSVSAKWIPDLFQSTWANLVASWCVKFHQDHGEAPGKAIESIFEVWSEKATDADTVKLVDKFLSALSNEYTSDESRLTSSYIIDLAGEHFNRVRLSRLANSIQGELELGKVEAAEAKVSQHSKLEIGAGAGIDLFHDQDAVRKVFLKERQSPLVTYSGPVQHFLGNTLRRHSFVSLLAPEKTGKTSLKVDIAYRAMTQRVRVAFFEIGDESEDDIYERFLVRASRHPSYSPGDRWPYTVSYPTSIKRPGKGDEYAEVVHEDRVFRGPLNFSAAWKACDKTMKNLVRSKKSYLRISCHPNLSIGVDGIKSILDSWALSEWVPDIVVIDYADNLSPPVGYKDKRDQINATWQHLRGLSISHHCLVLTSTQADAASYDRKLLDRRNFSEDKRKLAHVTAMIGLNVYGKEKELGIMRLNYVVRRKGEYSTRRSCHVAGCLPLGMPIICSDF